MRISLSSYAALFRARVLEAFGLVLGQCRIIVFVVCAHEKKGNLMKNNLVRRSVLFVLMASVWSVWSVLATVHAVEKNQATVITVEEMCGGCVTKITKHFAGVKDISDLKCDIKTKTVTFTPRKETELSSLKLWEEMDSIGKPPKKLVGPSGTFTSKPKVK